MRGQKVIGIFALSICLLILNHCNDTENSIQTQIDENNQHKDTLAFKIIDYDSRKKQATLQIQCDFNQVDSETYLNQLNQIEQVLYDKGIHDLSYQIKNKPGSSNYDFNNKRLTNNDLEDNFIERNYDDLSNNDILDENNSDTELSQSRNSSIYNSEPQNLLPNGKGEINFNYVRLREKPSTSSKINTYLFKGTVVKLKNKTNSPENIVNKSDYWYAVETSDKKKGWIFGKYVSKTDDNKISSSFQNNKIYNDFLNKKKLLVNRNFQANIDHSKRNVDIEGKRLILKLKNEKKLVVPFHVAGTDIQWNINNVELDQNRYQPREQEIVNQQLPRPKSYFDDNYLSDNQQFQDPIEEFFPEDFIEANYYKNKNYYQNNVSSRRGNYSSSEFDYPDAGMQKYNKPAPSDFLAMNSNELKNFAVPFGKKKQDIQNDQVNKNTYIPNQNTETYMPKSNYVSASDNYMLKTEIGEYLKHQLMGGDLLRAKAILKVIEEKLFSRDYENKKVRFHSNFNVFYDTLFITLQEVDFDRKIAAFEIRRLQPNPSVTGTKQVAFDRWEIDFANIDKKASLNFDRMNDIAYSEILLAIEKAGASYKNEIVAIANYVVNELLLKQKYIAD